MARPNYIANYLPKFIQEGFSATASLRQLREAGLSIADRTFYRLWGETQNHLANQQNFVDSPLNRRPTVDQIGIATRPRARGYLYNIELAVHDPVSGEVSFHAWGYRSQKLVSLSTALRGAVQSWIDASDDGRGTPGGNPLGGMVNSVLQLVGPEETLGADF